MNKPLPPPAQTYVGSINNSDPSAFIAAFAENAVVNDNGREFRGLAAIKAWSEHDIFAANVRLEVLDTTEMGSTTTVITKVEGTFDRTGLPDPVIISQAITALDGKIAELVCRPVEWPAKA